MTGTRLRLLAYGLGAALLIAALLAWFGRPQPVEVIVKKVDRGLVQDTTANTRAGTIKACRRAGFHRPLAANRQPAGQGRDPVMAGQLLLEIWNDDLRAEVALASSRGGKFRSARSPGLRCGGGGPARHSPFARPEQKGPGLGRGA